MDPKKLTYQALPIYAILPCICLICEHFDIFAKHLYFLNLVMYFIVLELFVFIDHYYFLHKWKHLHHRIHHIFKSKRTMNAWVSYAFYPLDGLSQGMPIIYTAIVVPVPYYIVRSTIMLVGIWTIYIHTNSFRVPYPFMGYDYHLIHHEQNWYNFGLFTVFWDVIWNTVKHPTKAE